MYKDIKVIGFDADDTLWHNENIFAFAHKEFVKLMQKYAKDEKIEQELTALEIENLPLYGYGVKSFTLSMLEAALKITKNKIQGSEVEAIVALGRHMINAPIVLLDGVADTLKTLSKNYKLIVVTKGDLLDQERKLAKSNISKYFDHIEIMSEKTPAAYLNLTDELDINPKEFLMVGNSVKSDIIPAIEIGASAVLVPFEVVGIHERADKETIFSENFKEVKNITELVNLLKS
ncbi:MAG: HAD family hydrolase [Elusimicrobiota bacterium]|jgi:putative hydrolase of the HAD superfamily|nr:HAD family hydrolase [Elusimicrobiota bacterium]